MAAIGSDPSHLIETRSPVFFLSVYDTENRRELYCVDAGNINAVLSPIGAPPLHYAISSKNIELARILLRNGADVNLRDNDGNSPLLLNCWRSRCNEIFHLLLENGADVNARGSDGWSGLHVVRFRSMWMELLQRGADANPRDIYGHYKDNSHMLLHWGAEIDKGTEGVVFDLVEDEACGMELFRKVFEGTGHTDIRDAAKCTPLHRAIREGRTDLVRLLLECGASVGARDVTGHTPLRTAVEFKFGVEVVSELIRKGADVNTKCNSGLTPLLWAFHYHNEALVGLLLSAGADPDVVEYAHDDNTCSPLLLKHSVLRNYDSRRKYAKRFPWMSNSRTCEQCLSEIESMKGTRLSPALTLYDVAFGDKWDISCARKVYEYMTSGEFPMYSGLAMPKLALKVKKHLGDGANNNSLFMQGLSKKSSFRTNQHVLLQIVKYLSDDDCLNLYIAGY